MPEVKTIEVERAAGLGHRNSNHPVEEIMDKHAERGKGKEWVEG